MPLIELTTVIRAPRKRVFDLARSIDAHQHTTSGTAELAVAGVTSGLIGMDDEVTWEARHFGVRQRLTSWTPNTVSLRLMEARVNHVPPTLQGPARA